MGTVRWICLDADDLMHENTGEANYNESAYYNFYDPAQRLGGFVRLGNRPNESYAEMTLCLLGNRRNGVTTRIAEGLTEWQWRGRVGYGWSEFLDHVD